MNPFSMARTPRLLFGPGKLSALHGYAAAMGTRCLLVTGESSFRQSPSWTRLLESLSAGKVDVDHVAVSGEPSPQLVDDAVSRFSASMPDVVVAIGGGSVMDAGKAISAMLPLGTSVKNYLEGIGKQTHPGRKVPFVAVPTTSGTGAEATKNAVLSEVGANGYKRSLRHDHFVPDLAIVDPELCVSCSALTTASSGMDAFTQLLESYLSTQSNAITDALAFEGLKQVSRCLKKAFRDGSDMDARTGMALAAYLSGVTLASAGLGLVHGFASSVGGFFAIPHGVICSRLMPAANKLTVRRLRQDPGNGAALSKYAKTGRLFSNVHNQSDEYYVDALIDLLDELITEMAIPSLNDYGILPADFERLVTVTDNKNNPVRLSQAEMIEVLSMAG